MKPTRNNSAAEKNRGEHKALNERFNGHAGNSAGRRKASWNDVDPIRFAAAVAAVVDAGDAVMCGSTSDGGALVITVLSGTDRKKWYPDDEISLKAALEQIYEAYLPDTERALRVQDTRARTK